MASGMPTTSSQCKQGRVGGRKRKKKVQTQDGRARYPICLSSSISHNMYQIQSVKSMTISHVAHTPASSASTTCVSSQKNSSPLIPLLRVVHRWDHSVGCGHSPINYFHRAPFQIQLHSPKRSSISHLLDMGIHLLCARFSLRPLPTKVGKRQPTTNTRDYRSSHRVQFLHIFLANQNWRQQRRQGTRFHPNNSVFIVGPSDQWYSLHVRLPSNPAPSIIYLVRQNQKSQYGLENQLEKRAEQHKLVCFKENLVGSSGSILMQG